MAIEPTEPPKSLGLLILPCVPRAKQNTGVSAVESDETRRSNANAALSSRKHLSRHDRTVRGSLAIPMMRSGATGW